MLWLMFLLVWAERALADLVGGINRAARWTTTPARRFAAWHHCLVAAEFDRIAIGEECGGRSDVAAELRACADERRQQARRLRR